MKTIHCALAGLLTVSVATVCTLAAAPTTQAGDLPYCVVDTGQIRCYNNRTEIRYPKSNAAFFGQDAHYHGHQRAYRNNGDGTVTDLITGLMWQRDPGAKKTYRQAVAGADRCKVGGYTDWRLPTIKELYSLILFSGTDPDPMSRNSNSQTPFIDTKYFKFQYGKARDGDRIIDSQWATSTLYVGKVMNNQQAMFGVNFADGRIKGYPTNVGPGGRTKTYYVIYVRGNTDYGRNDFVDNGDGTVTDNATGLMWMTVDSGKLKAGRKKDGALNWQEALAWAEDLQYAGHSDWRLPNAKELHSIVDYTRSPDTTRSAAIDPVLQTTAIANEGGAKDYPHYWTSTSHARVHAAESAVYLCFGRGLGFMQDRRGGGAKKLMDVHGAGAQRADLKSGNPSSFAQGRGPQGDVMRIYNYVRCVRGGAAEPRRTGPKVRMKYSRGRSPDADGDPPRPDGAPSGADWVRRLDRNGDGKVSRQEFDGPANHFTRFDRNRDGYLTANEAPQGPPPHRNQRPR